MSTGKTRVISQSGEIRYLSRSKGLSLIDSGEAELVRDTPLTIRIIDTAAYREELRQQVGRTVNITKRRSGVFKHARGGRKSTKCKPPRYPIHQSERDFQRYKTSYLVKKGEEEQARAKRRSGEGQEEKLGIVKIVPPTTQREIILSDRRTSAASN